MGGLRSRSVLAMLVVSYAEIRPRSWNGAHVVGSGEPGDARTYAFGHSDAEARRLVVQGRLFNPLTEQFLVRAGDEVVRCRLRARRCADLDHERGRHARASPRHTRRQAA